MHVGSLLVSVAMLGCSQLSALWQLYLCFGVLAGLGVWLVQGEFGLVPRILIAAGVLLLGIYVALDPEDVWARLTGRGPRR